MSNWAFTLFCGLTLAALMRWPRYTLNIAVFVLLVVLALEAGLTPSVHP